MATSRLTDCRILIIDDLEANVLLLEGILQEGGYEHFRSVLDSRDAVSAFTDFRPDMVLLDLMMPHFDGFAVMEQLKPLLASQSFLPIVVLTADARPDAKRRALSSGANDFLTKPLNAVEVLLRVRNLLETRILYLQQKERADERIKEQAALIDRASDAIFVLDLENRITFWNRGAETIFQRTAADAVGLDARALLFSDLRFDEAERALRETGQWSGELSGGADRTVASRWTLMNDAGGRPKSTLVICTDVTEKKKLEAQMQRNQRLESIGLLAGGIAHDLNNMLAPILMAVDLLQLNRGVPSSMVATLRSSAQRGTELVNQILTFARGGVRQTEPLNLRHLVNEVVQLARQTFSRSIAITVDVPADLWMIQGDATQIHQVLMNLCVNARDAMPSGGSLAVSCRNAEVSAEPSPGRYVILAIADTGAGIAPEIVDKIFDPFFTTKEPGKGTGLGLATVQEIVKKHGGLVRLASEIGKGSRFEVYLPAMLDLVPRPTTAPEPWVMGRGELILLVDDEAGLRRMVAMMLEAAGYRVMTAQNGAEALAIYERERDRIGVILTDMTMPLMDGEALVRALLDINSQARIIAASGVDIRVPGVRASLRKPYSAECLLATLRAVLT